MVTLLLQNEAHFFAFFFSHPPLLHGCQVAFFLYQSLWLKWKFLPGIRISLVLSVRKEHGTSSADIWVGAQELPDGPAYTWILSYLSAWTHRM